MDNDKLLRQSFISGVLVGVGVVVNLQTDNRYIGAMLFSIALLAIIECELQLYTGKIGFIGQVSITELLLMLFNNLLGITAATGLLCYALDINLTAQAIIKYSKTPLQLFILGLGCGILMFVAVFCKHSLITVFCIMTFILSGYEHCIADFPFLISVASIENLMKFACIVAGNTLGAIMAHKLIKNTGSKNNEESSNV